MNPESENFESLRRALALKRHEVPPPGYFNQFSASVISRIEAGDRAAKSPGAFAWLQNLWQTLERKPALAGAFGVAVCGLLVTGIVYSASVDSTGAVGFANNQPFQTFDGGANAVAFQSGGQPMLGVAADSTTPLMVSPQTSGSLFDQFNKVQVQPAAFNLGN